MKIRGTNSSDEKHVKICGVGFHISESKNLEAQKEKQIDLMIEYFIDPQQ